MSLKPSSALRASLNIDRAARLRVPAAAVMLLVVEVGLKVLGFPRLLRFLRLPLRDSRARPPADAQDVLSERERSIVDAVELVVRARPREGRCLRRALILGWHLRSRAPLLRIGVERENGAVSAHAWIEIDGQPVAAGNKLERFAPLGRSMPHVT